MSWYDTVLANTAGLAFSAATGKVDPWTLANQNEELAANIKKALGPNATDAEVATAQARAVNEQNGYLKSIGAHPDSPCVLNLPILGCVDSPEFLAKLEKIVYGLIAVGAIGAAIFFYSEYRSFFGRRK